MMRKALSIILAITLLFVFSITFTSCGDNNEKEKSDTTTSSEPTSSPDELEEKAAELNTEEDNFFGTWHATSENAEYLYGHLEITINEDGTFDADVTDESFSGTWEKIDGGIEYHSELMNGKLFYGKKCKMVIEDSDLCVTLEKID